jgi:glycosyltransferase involved in cell wall biosynthesis
MALTARQQARFRRLIGDFDPGMAPPRIPRVKSGPAPRPLWSVMIPTFNCAPYLRQTLASVLAQDRGPEFMQIEVVDDVSTRDDPEAVVRDIGGGRVAFHRKARNEGAIPNFNTCIERSRGRLVHVLHGDDFVEPGFYARLTEAAESNPRTAAFFVRCRVVDEDEALDTVAPRMRTLAKPTRDARELHHVNGLFTPGVVVRRAFYEKHGGFLPPLVHCADWEMWTRAITRGGGLWLNELLASYRFFAANDTSRLTRSAENIRDRLRLAAIFADRFPDFDAALCERTLARQALRQMQRFAAAGDDEGVAANRDVYHLLSTPERRRLLRQWDREIGIARTPRRLT